MIFRQLFDHESYTYTYLLADEATREAIIIDPVLSQVENNLRLINELTLKLIAAVDTHVHADHITALDALRNSTDCQTWLGNPGEVQCVDHALEDQAVMHIGKLQLKVIYTPGHTDDSYCFYLQQNNAPMLFTGDTLLIRGTGRTDFQNGDAGQLFDSLHQKILTLPKQTRVFPGHDYKGWHESTLAEEIAHNPRLAITARDDFIKHMSTLDLPNPKMMDIAVPANRTCGKQPG